MVLDQRGTISPKENLRRETPFKVRNRENGFHLGESGMGFMGEVGIVEGGAGDNAIVKESTTEQIWKRSILSSHKF